MKIGFFGDGPWAHETFNRLVEDKTIEISFVTARFDNRDPVLCSLAEKNNIPVVINSNINSEDYMRQIKGFNVDLFVSMSFDQIFSKKVFDYPPLKTINCHAGKLPFYRGRNVLNWVLINDEKEFGITVHYVDKGIDTGDIIIQKTYPITDADNYKTLLDVAYSGCAEVLYAAIKQIQSGTVERVEQDRIDPIGMYCGKRKIGDEVINWNSTSRDVFNFVRAICKPGPVATSSLNGTSIKINRCREVKGAKPYINNPGQIIGKTVRGFYVKTLDTFVEVLEFEHAGRIRVGDRMI